MSIVEMTPQRKSKQSSFQWIGTHGFESFLIVYGIWVFLPYFAPIFMQIGWTGAGKAIYFFYSFFCHQLPERSFFWFGEKTMYSLSEIQTAWQDTINPMILRQFIGNETMGWKIAWSDRMISFYTSVWLFAAIWYPFRRKIKPISWWGFILLLLPIAIDGGTHMVSDFAGIGQGFRDTNQWLVALTNNAISVTFYAGDALGSFNSIMRFITGILAGLGIVWIAFPYIFQTQIYNQKLDEKEYAKVIEQIKDQNPHPSGG
ncbi:MAG TPA: DUF2085 domain-containing protein [Anaerolineales bacterium]|nr:DUF2085 domain-containing protein [Anaerolineales bacterium]